MKTCGCVWTASDLLQALRYLALRLQDEYEVREVRLSLTRSGQLAQFDLSWLGTFMNNETAMSWLQDPMTTGGEASPLSVVDVIERCNGDIWFQRERVSHRAFFRTMLPAAEAPKDLPRAIVAAPEGERPEFYDFDIFLWSAVSHELDDRPLVELSYTIFDTETTGLQPSEGDEIIQIGATRIVNRRLLRQECFDQLVDPRRPLSPQSIAIHGITPELLVGQPPSMPYCRSFMLLCGHGSGRAQRRFRHALPAIEGGSRPGAFRATGARHPAAFGRTSPQPDERIAWKRSPNASEYRCSDAIRRSAMRW
jgi:DNA polymerase-3 subunit epsilon